MRVPPSDAGPKVVMVSCHGCGYSPNKVPADGCCPKCGVDLYGEPEASRVTCWKCNKTYAIVPHKGARVAVVTEFIL